MLHNVQHLFLSTSVSAQSYRRRGWRDGKRECVCVGGINVLWDKMHHRGGEGTAGEKEKWLVQVKKGMVLKERQGEVKVRKGEKTDRGRWEMERCTLCTHPLGFISFSLTFTHTKAKRAVQIFICLPGLRLWLGPFTAAGSLLMMRGSRSPRERGNTNKKTNRLTDTNVQTHTNDATEMSFFDSV